MTRLLLAALLVASAASVSAQDWQLVWADEFNTDGAPDPAHWSHEIGGDGWGNQERQYYTDRLENARVEDGHLVIEAREEGFEGSAYTSARLVSRDRASFQYGRIEASIKMPQGQGIWPAFWMMPQDSPYGGWPVSGEIDIMEFLGHDTDRVYGTLHYGGGSQDPCRGTRGGYNNHCFSGTGYSLQSGSFADDFHTFAIEWEPRAIRWYVDGQLYQTQTSWYSGSGPYPAPFDNPFFLILNLAVGGQWPGYPDATTTFPQQLQVDYVRVYNDANAAPTVTLDGPTSGTSVDVGDTLELRATATDGGTVTSVEFLQGDGILSVDTEAPYAFDLAGVADGCYSIRARATDNSGYVATTEPVAVTVGAGCPEGSRAPYLVAPASVPGFIEAEYFDLGGDNVAYRDLGANTGGGIRLDEDVDISRSGDGEGYDVTEIINREWLTYTIDVAETGRYRVEARIAAVTEGGIKLSVDGQDLLGEVTLAPTGSATQYADAPVGDIDLAAGRHVLRIDQRRGGYILNRFMVTRLTSTSSDRRESNDLGLRVAPNPARSQTRITYRVPMPGPVRLAVYDVVGRQVAVESVQAVAGEQSLVVQVEALSPGVYTCVLSTASGSVSERFAVVR